MKPKWPLASWNLTSTNALMTSSMACVLTNLYGLSPQPKPSSWAPTLLSARTGMSSESKPLNCDAGATRKPALHFIKLRLINTKLLHHPGFPPFHPRVVLPGSHWWRQQTWDKRWKMHFFFFLHFFNWTLSGLFGSRLILLQLEQSQMSATKYITEEVTVVFLSYSAS